MAAYNYYAQETVNLDHRRIIRDARKIFDVSYCSEDRLQVARNVDPLLNKMCKPLETRGHRQGIIVNYQGQ